MAGEGGRGGVGGMRVTHADGKSPSKAEESTGHPGYSISITRRETRHVTRQGYRQACAGEPQSISEEGPSKVLHKKVTVPN